MKHYLFVAISLILGMNGAFAQSFSLKPVAAKPVYFDVSPPLRDMVLVKPGLADRSIKNSVVPNKFGSDISAFFRQRHDEHPDASQQNRLGTLTGDTIISNFEGLSNVAGYVPPDTYGEAGPNHYFQVVNCSYAIYNKAGNQIFGPAPNSSVWNGMPNNENSGDAVVLYDENADRWLFTQFSLTNYPYGPFYQMIAISQTGDPMGSWYRYQYEFTAMPDYPKFGIWPDAYYMSSNDFTMEGWVGNGAYAYDRAAMLAGDPDALRIGFSLSAGSAGFITLYPSDCDGPFPVTGTPNYFGYVKLGAPQNFGIYEFHADFTNPGASTFGNLLTLDVTPFDLLSDGITQKNTNVRLETLQDRLMYRFQYRNFSDHASMVINHTVNAGSGRAGIRWYEFRNTSGAWSIYQQSTYAPADDNSRWMGSIAMDTAGSIALGFSASGPNLFPSVCYTGRKKSDPLNTMTITERTIVPGGGCQTGVWSGRSRWGDYSGMSIDPASPTTFWFTTEYYGQTSVSNWQTRIASFTFDNVFSSSASATPTVLCTGDSTQLESIAYGGSGNYTYSWSSIPQGFSSNLKNPKATPSDTTAYIVAVSDGITTRHDTVRISVGPLPVASAGNDTTVCQWTTAVDLTGTASNYKHLVWASDGDGTFSDRYALSTVYYPGPQDKQNGGAQIDLVVFANDPCEGKIFSYKNITIDPCTGMEEMKEGTLDMTVVPNPARDRVVITIHMPPQQQARLLLTDSEGKVCRSVTLSSTANTVVREIDLSGLSSGVYFVRLNAGTQVTTQRLIIQ
ncbi:MAG TPA: T9SS type A sorting domain-containing protein [Bacteroidales bacterium]|nr:T9SS type A sorting domain-containing protein [Bacteroidales bacterium]HPS74137.1 T9SS type A sorting domain-containing protein [Bacteroidales bacterium]